MYDAIIKLVADGLVLPVVFVGVWALVFRLPAKSNRIEVFSRILMAGLTAYLFAKLVGFIYQPQSMRPFELVGAGAGASYLDNPGFPSDHVLFCMAITLAVIFETRIRWLGYTLLSMTIAIGIGRILALVHTPLDVIGGVVIACSGIPWYLQSQLPLKENKKVGTEARKKINHAVK